MNRKRNASSGNKTDKAKSQPEPKKPKKFRLKLNLFSSAEKDTKGKDPKDTKKLKDTEGPRGGKNKKSVRTENLLKSKSQKSIARPFFAKRSADQTIAKNKTQADKQDNKKPQYSTDEDFLKALEASNGTTDFLELLNEDKDKSLNFFQNFDKLPLSKYRKLIEMFSGLLILLKDSLDPNFYVTNASVLILLEICMNNDNDKLIYFPANSTILDAVKQKAKQELAPKYLQYLKQFDELCEKSVLPPFVEQLKRCQTQDDYAKLGNSIILNAFANEPINLSDFYGKITSLENHALTEFSQSNPYFTALPEEDRSALVTLLFASKAKLNAQMLSLLENKNIPKDMAGQISSQFKEAFGGYGCFKMFTLLEQGLGETKNQYPFLNQLAAHLWEEVVHDVADRNTASLVKLHGLTRGERLKDYSAELAKYIANRSLKDVNFKPIPSQVPELKIDFDLSKVSPQPLKELIGREDTKSLTFEVNGRTVRFSSPNGDIRALKFMRQNETPGDLLRELKSFEFMHNVFKDKEDPYPALPVGDSPVLFKMNELPSEVQEKLTQEAKNGGFEIGQYQDQYVVICYDIKRTKEMPKPNDFFQYVEEAVDDKSFLDGFVKSMKTLGKMADMGVFNPSLILNSYHDVDKARPFVWSPIYLGGETNTGSEKQYLSNAHWSNFRVGGLADPDEFRSFEQLFDSEFNALVGNSNVGNLNISKEEFVKKGKLTKKSFMGFLIGRMIHESLVIATRRMVLQGAFDSSKESDPGRATELKNTFKNAIKQGLMAFSKEFIGDENDFLKALKDNGLDLEKSMEDILKERESFYSYEYTELIRQRNSKAIKEIFGGDAKFEFDPIESDKTRPGNLDLDRESVLKRVNPVQELAKSLPMGWTTMIFVDEDGNPTNVEDLGWMTALLDMAPQELQETFAFGPWQDKVTASTNDSLKDSHGTVVTIKTPKGFPVAEYLPEIRRKLNEIQDVGAFNGAYFFLNSLRSNHIISSTLVDCRAKASN